MCVRSRRCHRVWWGDFRPRRVRLQRSCPVNKLSVSGGCALRTLQVPGFWYLHRRLARCRRPSRRISTASRSASRSCSNGAFTASGGCALRAMIRLRISSRRTGKVAGARILLSPTQASRSASGYAPILHRIIWWLRSPVPAADTACVIVRESGSAIAFAFDTSNAGKSNGVAFGFDAVMLLKWNV